MTIEVLPAVRFEDVATLLAPKNPDSPVCWCLTYRLSSRQNRELGARQRPQFVRGLCERALAPGVLAYLEGEVVGWAGVAPRSELYAFSGSGKIPHVDDLPVWSVWCLKVRPGFRKRGVTAALLRGAVDFARDHGAPAIEGYPVDNGDRRVNATTAFVGTRSMFERAGFSKAADTDSVRDGMPRIVMRLAL
jgi:GNAT superfamily N-acetyltransferase